MILLFKPVRKKVPCMIHDFWTTCKYYCFFFRCVLEIKTIILAWCPKIMVKSCMVLFLQTGLNSNIMCTMVHEYGSNKSNTFQIVFTKYINKHK